MATKTFDELKQLAIQIRDEKTNKQNTATRVGTEMLEHLNKLEQDYYDKTKTDEELKKRDNKLTELGNKIGKIDITPIEGAEALESLIVEDKTEAGVGEEGYLSRVEIPVKRNSGYIGKVGQIASSSLAYYSDFIPVKKGEVYEAIAVVTGSVSSITSYSEENDGSVVDVNVPDVSNNTSTVSYKIPDGVICMRYSTYTADKSNKKNGLYAREQ